MRTFQFSPNIRTWDLIINEDNLKKAWNRAEAEYEKEKERWADAPWLEDRLWSIFCEAINNEEYPIFNVYPWGYVCRVPYTIAEIEDGFPHEYYDFCWEKAEEVAKDLGLYIKE